MFEAAFEERVPVLLKGPTGCGKTRFVEYMAWRLGRPVGGLRLHGSESVEHALPIVTVACHEDLTASDLVGRYLLEGETTRWIDGPLTRAVKAGAICYLDEVVEARKDTTVLIHPLTDYRRLLPIEKRAQVLEAAEGFLLVISYNPGYQSALKDLKHSTRQRFIAIEFDYPPRDQEAEIIAHEAEVDDRDRQRPRQAGREGAQPARARPRRRRQHSSAGLRRQADPQRHPRSRRLPVLDHLGPDRRRRGAAHARRGRQLDLRVAPAGPPPSLRKYLLISLGLSFVVFAARRAVAVETTARAGAGIAAADREPPTSHCSRLGPPSSPPDLRGRAASATSSAPASARFSAYPDTVIDTSKTLHRRQCRPRRARSRWS